MFVPIKSYVKCAPETFPLRYDPPTRHRFEIEYLVDKMCRNAVEFVPEIDKRHYNGIDSITNFRFQNDIDNMVDIRARSIVCNSDASVQTCVVCSLESGVVALSTVYYVSEERPQIGHGLSAGSLLPPWLS